MFASIKVDQNFIIGSIEAQQDNRLYVRTTENQQIQYRWFDRHQCSPGNQEWHHPDHPDHHLCSAEQKAIAREFRNLKGIIPGICVLSSPETALTASETPQPRSPA